MYRLKWSKWDGLGALIIAPARELALQIFEVLRTFAKYHCYSAGLVVGGNKNFEEEKKLIGRMNIVVGTPGRILDMVEEGVLSIYHARSFVIDEADLMLDLKFIDKIDALLVRSHKDI
ncbi:MAG: DEAD/DEAH box helicase, partial [Bacillales bacterium]